MVVKKTKKVLGFVTTSFILLMMVAAATTTASLQQEDNATIDEPNIPIEPPDEEEEEPEDIPDNENDTGDDGDDGGGSGGGAGDGNVIVDCPAILERMFQTDKKTYKLGEDVIVTGSANAGGRVWGNVGTPVEIRWRGPENGSYGSNEVQPEYYDCGFSYTFVLEKVQQPGMWEMSAVYPPGDDGEVIGKTQFEVVPAEEVGCQKPPVRHLTTGTTTHNLGDDVIVSGLFSLSPRDRENNTPVEVRYKGPEDASYVSNKVQPKYSSYGGCRYLGFEFPLKNVQQPGMWDVSAVYRPLNIDLYTQFVVYPGLGAPRCEDIGSPGNGGADDDYCRDDQDDNPDGPIDTWIFWITTPVTSEGSASRYIQYGGTIRSSTVDVQFESWVSGGGVSHVELKIDGGKYKPAASQFETHNGYSYSAHTITGLSDGTHTIYARTVDKAGNVDPTPAWWTFTVNKQAGRNHPDTWINSVRTPEGKNIPNSGSTASKAVTVDFQGTVSGPGSHIDLKLDNRKWVPVASPKTIPGVSVGNHTIYLRAVDQDGDVDPTPAKWTFTVKKDKDGGYPETWVNWVRASPRGVNIADGGSTPSSTVIVDFQGTVAGRGSHIDLKIDSGSYVPVASPHTITGLSDGPHTIYLRALDRAGNIDPTPAKWRFTVGEDDNGDDCDDERLHEARVKVEKNFTPVDAGVMRVEEDDQACEILVTVRSEQHVKAFPISSMDGFPIRVEVLSYKMPLLM
jgi:hypothetical protein